MSWDININPEKSDPELDDIKRRITEAEDWGKEHIHSALHDAKDMMLKSKATKRRDMADDAAYTGIAFALGKLFDEVIPLTVKEMEDKGLGGRELDRVVENAKTMFLAKIVKELVDKADEIRRM